MRKLLPPSAFRLFFHLATAVDHGSLSKRRMNKTLEPNLDCCIEAFGR